MRRHRRNRLITVAIVGIFFAGITYVVHDTGFFTTDSFSSVSPVPQNSTPQTSTSQTSTPISKPVSSNVQQYVKDLNIINKPDLKVTTKYNRSLFGPAWKDMNHNGCDTRNDILIRDLKDIKYKSDTHNCIVLSGVLPVDPYTGKTINFTRGIKTSTAIQIDHIIPLSYSWSAGSAVWSKEKKETFANDPTELLAADGSSNERKSDKGPSEWMPPNAAYHCIYAEKFITVAVKYNLSVKSNDVKALQVALRTCK